MTTKSVLRKSLIAALTMIIFNVCSGQNKTPSSGVSDIVVIANANILTMNQKQPNAEAMALKGQKIIAVGDLNAVKKIAGSKYEFYDLDGGTIVPGFIETHEHMVQFGSSTLFVDITPFACPSLKEALTKLKKYGQVDKDGWIYAWAVDQTLYTEKRGPTKQELDELFPDVPVFIFHMSGHGAYANSKALEKAGITKDSPNPQGGEFEKDKNGELTGYLKGMPAWLQVGKFPDVSKETTMKSGEMHAAVGFTTVSEFGIMNPLMLKLLKGTTMDPNFPVRVLGGMFITMPGFKETALQASNYETDLFKVKYVKTWTDGSTQGGTGFFTQPFYKLDADTKKGARGTQDEFNEQITMIMGMGFAPGIHANGDAAMDLALNAIEYARKKTGKLNIRPHLIHCQYVRPDQFDRIKKLGNIGMTFMSPHIYYWGDMHRDLLLGPDRAAQICSINEAISRGIPYAIHNDAPVTPPNALFSMWVAVNRLTSSGKPLGPNQRITAEQALLAYTLEAAKVLGIEKEVGSLEIGKFADFVVLESNPLRIDPKKIKDIKIVATVMNGKLTYSKSKNSYSIGEETVE
jgi:predicted amidohydrolase YtcJ